MNTQGGVSCMTNESQMALFDELITTKDKEVFWRLAPQVFPEATKKELEKTAMEWGIQ